MLQAKNNFKVKEAFQTLIRTILANKPTAGLNEGSGGVFGAGVEQRYEYLILVWVYCSFRAAAEADIKPVVLRQKSSQSAQDAAKEKKKKSKCLIL